MPENLIQNGTFETADNWTWESGWAWQGGKYAQYGYPGVVETKLYQNFTTEPGAIYKFTFDFNYCLANNRLHVGFKDNGGNMVSVASYVFADLGNGKTFDFEAKWAANQIAFWMTQSSPGFFASIDTISVVQLASRPLVGGSLAAGRKGLVG